MKCASKLNFQYAKNYLQLSLSHYNFNLISGFDFFPPHPLHRPQTQTTDGGGDDDDVP